MPDFEYKGRLFYNPAEFAMYHIGGTWKMPILWRLRDKTLRYNELKQALPKITHKMLSTQLKELQDSGMVHKEVYPVIPPKTEYSLTPKGKRAIEIINVIREYGLELMKEEGIEHP